MDVNTAPPVPPRSTPSTVYRPVQDAFTGAAIRPEVLTAWENAGSPGWATAVLPLLADQDAFDKTVAGPSVALGRWKARAEREGLTPTRPADQAA